MTAIKPTNLHPTHNIGEIPFIDERILCHLIEGEYLKFPGISRSRLGMATKSMDHYWGYESGDIDTVATRFGTMFDRFVLGGFYDEYHVWGMPYPIGVEFERTTTYKTKEDKVEIITSSGLKTKENSDAKKLIEAENPGKTLVGTEDFEKMDKMLFNLRWNKATNWYLRGVGYNRLPLTWTEGELVFKIELDRLKITGQPGEWELWPVDVKSMEDASDRGFMSHCAKYHYDIQDILYCRGLERVFPGAKVNPMTFLLSEKETAQPNCVGIDPGKRDEVKDWLETTIERIRQGETGGYSQNIETGRKTLEIYTKKFEL